MANKSIGVAENSHRVGGTLTEDLNVLDALAPFQVMPKIKNFFLTSSHFMTIF
jgi:hypothetical protein